MHEVVKGLGAIALCWAATACYRGPQVEMLNPLVTGQVPFNKMEQPDRWTERGLAIPQGALTLSASMRSLDEREVCFDIDLNTVAQRQHRASLDGWEAYLRGEGEPEFVDPRARIAESLQVESQMYEGSVPRSEQINERVCSDTGRCYNRTVTVTRSEIIDVEVLNGGGTLCFANNGHINRSTEHITLHMHDRSPGGWVMGIAYARPPEKLRFRWKFRTP